LIFGGIRAKVHLPVSINEEFKVGTGIEFPSLSRLGYTIPERVGMNSQRLAKIDSVAQYAVDSLMTPGIQLLVARKGKVVYNKNFGYHTYNNKEKVKSTYIYDLASLTKIVSTLPLLMELEENGIVTLDTKLSEILTDYKGSNKENVTIKKMLSHYAQLNPWIPFYVNTLDSISKKPSAKYYRSKRSDAFNIEVTDNLFLRSDYQDSIQEIINDSDLLRSLSFRYCCLPFYIVKKFIEKNYNKYMDEIVQQHLYQSLAENSTTSTPRETFSNKQNVTT